MGTAGFHLVYMSSPDRPSDPLWRKEYPRFADSRVGSWSFTRANMLHASMTFSHGTAGGYEQVYVSNREWVLSSVFDYQIVTDGDGESWAILAVLNDATISWLEGALQPLEILADGRYWDWFRFLREPNSPATSMFIAVVMDHKVHWALDVTKIIAEWRSQELAEARIEIASGLELADAEEMVLRLRDRPRRSAAVASVALEEGDHR